MSFQVLDLSIQLVETLAPLRARIAQRDRSLEDQLRRAANSISLNLGESRLSDPGNRRARLCTAAGSAGEVEVALRLAVAWRVLRAEEVAKSFALLRRIIAILWKLTR